MDEAASYEHPIAPSHGIEAVIVNGVVVWSQGRSTGAHPGHARGSAPAKAAAAATQTTTLASPLPFAITPMGNGFSPSLRRIFITRSADFGRTMIV